MRRRYLPVLRAKTPAPAESFAPFSQPLATCFGLMTGPANADTGAVLLDVDFDGIIDRRFYRQIHPNRHQLRGCRHHLRWLLTRIPMDPATQQIRIHAMRQGDRRNRYAGLAKRHKTLLKFRRMSATAVVNYRRNVHDSVH